MISNEVYHKIMKKNNCRSCNSYVHILYTDGRLVGYIAQGLLLDYHLVIPNYVPIELSYGHITSMYGGLTSIGNIQQKIIDSPNISCMVTTLDHTGVRRGLNID